MSKDGDGGCCLEAPFVTSASGGSVSCLFLTACNASMFVVGGVFSSLKDFCVLTDGVGVSEPARVGLDSGVRVRVSSSHSTSLEFLKPLSGDLLSTESLSFVGLGGACTLCIRRWGASGRITPLSGDGGGLLV